MSCFFDIKVHPFWILDIKVQLLYAKHINMRQRLLILSTINCNISNGYNMKHENSE